MKNRILKLVINYLMILNIYISAGLCFAVSDKTNTIDVYQDKVCKKLSFCLSPKSVLKKETEKDESKDNEEIFSFQIPNLPLEDQQSLELLASHIKELDEDDFIEELYLIFGSYNNYAYKIQRIIAVPENCFTMRTYDKIKMNYANFGVFIMETAKKLDMQLIGDLHNHPLEKQIWSKDVPRGPSDTDGLEKEFSDYRNDESINKYIAEKLFGVVLEADARDVDVTFEELMTEGTKILRTAQISAYFYVDSEIDRRPVTLFSLPIDQMIIKQFKGSDQNITITAA